MEMTIEATNDARPDAHDHVSRRAGRRGKRGSSPLPTVLVVDDVKDNLVALEAMLRRGDVEIVTASSGRRALEVLLERDVAVAIVDVMMPEMDGFELAELIRGVDRTRHVPIIFVTAGSQADYRVVTGYGTGAIDFLFKPLDERILRAKVDVLVTLDRQRRQIDRALEQAERSRAETESLFRIARASSRSDAPEDVYEPALDALVDLFDVDRSAILLSDEAGVMRCHASRGLSERYRKAVEGRSPWARGEEDPRCLLVPDVAVAEDEGVKAYRDALAAEKIRAIGLVPLVAQRELLGCLMLHWDQPRQCSEHDERLLVTVAAHVAEAIHRARLRNAERAARAKAESALRYNEIFAGILAHDLQTPLSTTVTAAQLLQLRLRAHGEEVLKPLNLIAGSSQRMARMIDQLLDLTRARIGGGFALQPIESDLAKLCAEVVAELELAHPTWRMQVKTVGTDFVGTWDPDRLLQVVSNVLANAGQHGAAGYPIDIELSGAEQHVVRLDVHNAGAIPEALLPNIFSPFRGTRRLGSLGLGLFITKEIVASHGGTVEVASSEPTGTTFSISLPRHCARRDSDFGK